MDKIYVVTSGCYSSYCIEKIFLKREDADQYCALQNANDGWSINDNKSDLDFGDKAFGNTTMCYENLIEYQKKYAHY